MVLDIIGITLVLIFFIRGYMKGIIVAAFSLLAIVLGIICALKLSHLLAEWFYKNNIITSGWGQLLSYVLLFILVVFIVRLIAKAIQSSFEAMMLGWVNKAIGGLLYAAMAAFAWSSVLWIGDHMHLFTTETIAGSKTYPYFSRIASWVCEQVGKLLPFAKNVFSDLQHFFEHVNQKIPEHVGAAG